MKKAFLILCLAFTSIVGMAQIAQNRPTEYTNNLNDSIEALFTRIDSILVVDKGLAEPLEKQSSLKGRYKLYQTNNIYNLLQLDTKTGKIKQVQWSLETEKEVSVTINGIDLSYGYYSYFELYPTKNMYQFILIDTTDGRKWHVQWGLESDQRWIRRMY